MAASSGDSRPVIDSLARRSRKDTKDERRYSLRSLSLAGQHAVNLRRIEEYGGVLGKQFEERGISAWKPGVERPAFEAIIARLESGQAQGICIYDVDRFLRRVKDALRVVEIADRGFIVLDADGSYDLMTPNGRQEFYNRAVAAESFSFKQSAKLKRTFEAKASIFNEAKNGRFRALGFEEDGNTVREPERAIIRRVVRVVLEGGTWQEGCELLNECGIMTGAGNPWTRSPLRVALTAPRMAGYITMGGEIKGRLPGESIIPETDWQELLMLVQSRRGRPPSNKYMCSGFVLCGNCGHKLSGRPYRKGLNYSDGEPRRIYLCRAPDGGCGKHVADQRALDEYMGILTVRWMSDERNIEYQRRRARERDQQTRPHLKEIGRLKRLIDHWDKKLNDGTCDIERHTKMVSGLEAKLEAEQETIKDIGEAPNASVEESVDQAQARWDATRYDPEARRKLFLSVWQGYEIRVDPASISNEEFKGRVHVTPLDHPESDDPDQVHR
jgi:site-specific DNA recombinase